MKLRRHDQRSVPSRPLAADPAVERARLVDACIEVLDVATTDAVRDVTRRALADVGVLTVVADGEVFDPSRHRAVDVDPTTDISLHNRVSTTDRPGYADHGRLIRPTDVVVYRLEQR